MANEFKARNGIITPTLQSTVADGTSPLSVVSTTVVSNLNADLLDGKHASAFALSGHAHSYYVGTTAVQTSSTNQDVTGVLSITGGVGNTDMTVTTANTDAVSSGILYVRTGTATAASGNYSSGSISIATGGAYGNANAGSVSIYAGDSGVSSATAGNVSIQGGSTKAATSTGGKVVIWGGSALSTANTSATGGTTYIHGGRTYNATGAKQGGDIYIEGGSDANTTGYASTAGRIYIGTNTDAYAGTGTSSVSIGSTDTTTIIAGTIKLPTVGTSGFVKLGTGGQLSADTSSYLPLSGGTMTGAITFAAGQTWPTFNQSTTGTASNVTGTVAIANGGTGATSAATALTNLGALPTSGGTMTGAITFAAGQTWPTFNQNTSGSAARLTINRSFSIGNTARSFDGSADVTWTLADIGAQATLVSGTNIKTINGTSLLGSGDIAIAGGGSSVTTISEKTANYTVVAGDLASIINVTSYTGSLTVTLSSAATLGAGFYCWVWFNPTTATSNGYITVTPSASQTIDSKSTLILRGGEGLLVISNGSNWEIGAKRTMKAYSENFSKGNTVVASGLSSIAMGESVTSSGTGSFCAGGTSNIASGASASVVGGFTNYAQAQYSIVAGGSNNTITSAGNYSNILGGYSNNISGKYSIAAGYGASVSQDGKWAYSSASIAANGDAQTGIMVLRASTIDATATVLKSSASAAGTTNQVILPNNSAFAFSGLIVAKQKTSDGTKSAAWRVEGLLLRGATAATTTLVNSAITVISNASNWVIALAADTINGGLTVTATGEATTNIYWVATMQTSEVTYA